MGTQYPITVEEIKFSKSNEVFSGFGVEVGTPVAVRPVASVDPEERTYVGIYLGEVYTGHPNTRYNRETKVLTIGPGPSNPAIFVPALKRIVMGYESWWAIVENVETIQMIEEERSLITDDDIDSAWYVQVLRRLTEALEPDDGGPSASEGEMYLVRRSIYRSSRMVVEIREGSEQVLRQPPDSGLVTVWSEFCEGDLFDDRVAALKAAFHIRERWNAALADEWLDGHIKAGPDGGPPQARFEVVDAERGVILDSPTALDLRCWAKREGFPWKVYYCRDFSIAELLLYDRISKEDWLEFVSTFFDAFYVMVREVQAESLEDVFVKMQGEVWSPNGEACDRIRHLGLSHTSMSVGDVARRGDQYWICFPQGWQEFTPGEGQIDLKSLILLSSQQEE